MKAIETKEKKQQDISDWQMLLLFCGFIIGFVMVIAVFVTVVRFLTSLL